MCLLWYNATMIRMCAAIFLVLLTFSGCVNKRGISAKYYNDCREYYDLQGYYHKECDENIIDFKDVGDMFKEKEPEPTSNVW